ncbi:CaiB/BaiF CoA transferase family protein [Haloplanus sp. GCM10025708]|uniref:CaiB/BaiF CoA transferase family protein n=1 Tax=Haloferacaceae TaxID=1644056 RepID=UPI00360B2A5F
MLSGVKVICVDVFLAGPFASRMLAELGADVVKVEHISRGDPYRYLEHRYDDGTPDDLTHRFAQYNRGKRSLALDLKSEEGKEVFESLAADADIILENLRPNKMSEFGLGYEDVREYNEDVIYCSISGYGETGPYNDRGGIDTLIQAMSGVVHQNSADAGGPALTGVYLADITGSMYATISVLAALVGRYNGEGGQHIDLSLLDGLVSLLNHEAAQYSAEGTAPPEIRSSLVPQGVYETADGAVALNVLDKDWDDFCEVLGFDEWRDSERFDTPLARQHHKDEIDAAVEERLSDRPTEAWVEELLARDVLVAPMQTVDEAFEDDAVQFRGIVNRRHQDGIGEHVELEYPARFDDYAPVTEDAPRFGEHTEEILAEIGFSPAEIEALCERGIVKRWQDLEK